MAVSVTIERAWRGGSITGITLSYGGETMSTDPGPVYLIPESVLRFALEQAWDSGWARRHRDWDVAAGAAQQYSADMLPGLAPYRQQPAPDDDDEPPRPVRPLARITAAGKPVLRGRGRQQPASDLRDRRGLATDWTLAAQGFQHLDEAAEAIRIELDRLLAAAGGEAQRCPHGDSWDDCPDCRH